MTISDFAVLFLAVVCCASAGFCWWAVRIMGDYVRYIKEMTREDGPRGITPP